MNKLFKKTSLLGFVLFIFILTACSANKLQNSQLPEKKPSDFNFILNYRVNAKNQLDTQKGIYTKDMVTLPSVTTTLKLSDEEINEIYKIMKNIKSYPNHKEDMTNIISKNNLYISYECFKKCINGTFT